MSAVCEVLLDVLAVVRELLLCFWAWLSGKKTVLAAIYWALYTNAWPPFWKDVLGLAAPPEPWNWILNTIGIVLTVVGLGHKVFKRKTE